ncbi:MAG: hypothetical protein ACLUKN_15910 [Bacilli bacterium]
MGIAKMRETGADCLMATDPDADRMGVAIHPQRANKASSNEYDRLSFGGIPRNADEE